MARKNEGRIFVARSSFSATIDGTDYTVHKDLTRVREGHPLLDGDRAQFFEVMVVDYDIEQATAAPGERRGEQ